MGQSMRPGKLTRRLALKGAGAAGAVALAAPAMLRAQPSSIRIGAIHPVTGALAETGQACRLGAQMAVEYVNARGGIKSMGGAPLELVLGDSQSNADVARAEAARLITAGVTLLQGAFASQHTAAIVAVAQQRQIPFIIDIGASAVITRNVAQSVRDGKQERQYVYRICPSSDIYAAITPRHMAELFADAKVSVKRLVLIHNDDLLGQSTAQQFKSVVAKGDFGFSIVEAISFPESTMDLSTEVARLKAAKPDVVCPILRPAAAALFLQELRRQRASFQGIIGVASAGLYEPYQIRALKGLMENVMNDLPWPNYQRPRVNEIAAEYAKRSGGLSFDLNPSFPYEAVLVIADVMERAKTTDPVGIVEAIKATRFADGINIATGPISFDENGDNASGTTGMLQILDQQAQVVWPKSAAQRDYV
ncbi:MAG: ABC transporter substrate-binding protein, partial [Solimonas sp.]